MKDVFRNPTSARAMRIAHALVDSGLLARGSLDEAYDVVCGILNVCQYCKTVLLPQDAPIYCDSSACEDKAGDEEPPEDD